MIRNIAVASMLVLALAACANNTAGVSINAQGQVSVESKSLGKEVSLSEVRAKQIGQVLRASVLVTNLKSTDIELQYKFYWYDAEGFAVEDDASPWIPLQLYGKARQQVMGVAPNPSAVNFNLTVRPVYSE